MHSSSALPVTESIGKALGSQAKPRRAWWPWFKRVAALAFFVLVAYLLVSQARTIEWHQVFAALKRYPPAAIAAAAGLATVSLVLYSCFDLLGRRYTGHALNARTVMAVTFTSYVFNLNFGSLIGGIAFRYRLYSRLGLETGAITRIMSLSMLTNWIGYLLLAGLIFSIQPPAVPAGWKINATELRWIGVILLAIVAGYMALCAFSRRRTIRLRSHEIDLPSARMAGLQLLMGAGNWLVMSGIVFILLQRHIEFSAVASVLLLAAVAGVVTHVPAGLGVLEAVFVALLSHQMARPELLAGLLGYRVVYYLAPLAVAIAMYLVMEARAKQLGKPAEASIKPAN